MLGVTASNTREFLLCLLQDCSPPLNATATATRHGQDPYYFYGTDADSFLLVLILMLMIAVMIFLLLCAWAVVFICAELANGASIALCAFAADHETCRDDNFLWIYVLLFVGVGLCARRAHLLKIRRDLQKIRRDQEAVLQRGYVHNYRDVLDELDGVAVTGNVLRKTRHVE